MTEQELRALVRDAIARYASGDSRRSALSTPAGVLHLHPSHGQFPVPSGGDADGPCIIEPAAACNHCGYCKSYGH
jgi:hypothetical protein